MNISQPVISSLEAVEFSFLHPDEIRAISARRIDNEQTFDSLNNPVPGGLYDPALGSWGDSLCTTCNLSQVLCPGHTGHIDLSIPVYHPVFMDQIYRLMKAQCIYCHTFRLARHEVHRYACMLRLLQHGLLHEAQMIDAINQSDFDRSIRDMMLSDVPAVAIDEADDDSDAALGSIMRAREAYVNDALRKNRAKIRPAEMRRGKHEGASAMRRELVRDFLTAIVQGKKCAACGGISPGYRKDRCLKIFERELTTKEKALMAMAGKERANPLVTAHKPTKRSRSASDEGVADVDMSSGSDENSESEGQGEDLEESGNMTTPTHPKTHSEKTSSLVRKQRYLPVPEVMARLELLFEKEQDILSLLYDSKPQQRQSKKPTASMFFLQTLLVPPNRYRPEVRAGDVVTQAQQNNLYQLILRSSAEVAQISREISYSGPETVRSDGTRRMRDIAAFHEACMTLQDCVNALIDQSKNPVQGLAAKRNEDGIKQKLEKKEGLFRMNMMGKRVNYAARSVISPDPNIETNEIGVPPVFASKLTYPEPVTSHNFKDMQQAVVNGVERWPGASAIETESGLIINLRNKSLEDRVSLANQLLTPAGNNLGGRRNKKVHRHLSNGDVVLMNRQPTLHKPSIMGHRVRVLAGEKTIRMHYANCNTYNADFDGDEMNMHFPQNELARAEALQLADTDHQYISGTAGKPLRGLIQDHLSVSVALCNKDTLFDRESYQQLVYSALRPESGHIMGERIELVIPAVVKPAVRWTGKQVITTILKNIRPPNCGDLWMSGQSQIKGDRWGGHWEEGQVLFRDGHFISGILDKAQLGPSSGGFVHSVHEVYGPAIAGKLLSSMGRLLTRYLNMRAFTCGMDDLRMTRAGEANRKEKLEAAGQIGLEVAAQYVSLKEHKPGKDNPELLTRLEDVLRDDKKQEGLDLLLNQTCARLSTDVTSTCLPAGLEKQFPKNQMQSMTTSGAKGGTVNANLISCNLGQQILEGRRVPVMVSGKTLPCFKPFDTDVRAGGYIISRFLTGIRPQEYFFHLMAGREGLIDTAVKTSRSGYLQRCVIKGMEGLEVAYDTTVRDSDGTVCQFLYGEDGLDVAKQKYLTDFGFILHNRDSHLAQTKYSDVATQSLFQHKDLVVKQMKDAIRSARSPGPSAFDPVISVLDPARFAFATSEFFFGAMMGYIKSNKDGLIRQRGITMLNSASQVARKTAEKLLSLKYLRSLVEPGEAVGIVAGQSIGEPSTQMTLNTFHLAGHSAKNVTLGIPRLREILMTASKQISTPTMTLILNEELSEGDGRQFAKAIAALSLAHVLDVATVRESTGKGVAHPLAKIYTIRLRFFRAPEYNKTYAIGVSDVLTTVEQKFLPVLESLIKKAIKKAQTSSAATPQVGVRDRATQTTATDSGRDGEHGAGGGGNNAISYGDDGDGSNGGGGDNDDDSDENEDDATNVKARANRTEAVSYGPNDDDDDAIQKRMEQDALSDEDGEDKSGFRDEEFQDSSLPENGTQDEDINVRERLVKSQNRHVTRFRCDRVDGEWCEITLEFDAAVPKFLMIVIVQEAVRKSLIQQIHGVGNCTFVPDETIRDPRTREEVRLPVVHTEGANLRAMQQYGDYINPNRISTNDIAAMLDVYGVEACRATIVRELRNVFDGHGISVDMRHLNLIADYMTRNGGFTPFNRMGLVGNISPFTKMSFETTFAFLKDAVLDGDWDALSAPSSRLVMGKLSKVGTGSFDILTQVPTEHLDPMSSRKVAA